MLFRSKFSVDFRCAPAGILLGHSTDKRADFASDFGPTAAWSGPPAPVEAEAGAMPIDDRLGPHENVGPAGPEAAERGPKEPVQGVELGPWTFPLEYGNLLTEGEDFEGGVAAAAEEDAECGEDREGELEHELTLVTWRNVTMPGDCAAPASR